MLRSKAPSIQAKRKSLGEIDENNLENSFNGVVKDQNRHNPKRSCTSNYRIALTPIRNFSFQPNLKLVDDIIRDKDSHDDLIRNILNRPFKIPISNYTGM